MGLLACHEVKLTTPPHQSIFYIFILFNLIYFLVIWSSDNWEQRKIYHARVLLLGDVPVIVDPQRDVTHPLQMGKAG